MKTLKHCLDSEKVYERKHIFTRLAGLGEVNQENDLRGGSQRQDPLRGPPPPDAGGGFEFFPRRNR